MQKCIPFPACERPDLAHSDAFFLGVGMQRQGLVDSKKQFTSSPFSMYALADLQGLSSDSVVLTTIYAITRKELRSCGVKLAFG
jgi:hypothetical protein